MQVSFTFRNFEATDDVKTRATEKAEKIKKYMKSPIQVHFIFNQDKPGVGLEINASGDHCYFSASVTSKETFAAIDEGMDKIISQLKRHKEKISHKKGIKKPPVVSEIE